MMMETEFKISMSNSKHKIQSARWSEGSHSKPRVRLCGCGLVVIAQILCSY